MERHLKNTTMKVSSERSSQSEVESRQLVSPVRSTPIVNCPTKGNCYPFQVPRVLRHSGSSYVLKRSSKTEEQKIKKRMGSVKYYGMKYKLRHRESANAEPQVALAPKKQINELCKSLQSITLVPELKSNKKKVLGLYTHVERKIKKRVTIAKKLKFEQKNKYSDEDDCVCAQAGEEFGERLTYVFSDSELNSKEFYDMKMREYWNAVSSVQDPYAKQQIISKYIDFYRAYKSQCNVEFVEWMEKHGFDSQAMRLSVNKIMINFFTRYTYSTYFREIKNISRVDDLILLTKAYIDTLRDSNPDFIPLTVSKNVFNERDLLQFAQLAKEHGPLPPSIIIDTGMGVMFKNVMIKVYNAADRVEDFVEETFLDPSEDRAKLVRVLETLVIAFYNIYRIRDIQIFITEMINIVKAITGEAFCLTSWYSLVVETFTVAVSAIETCSVGLRYVKENCTWDNIVKYFQSLFVPQAQAVSDWMETELFRICTNWFSYLCYWNLDKKKVAEKGGFIKDLLLSTMKDGKKKSDDILPFLIRTVEYILKYGRQMLAYEGSWREAFVRTFYHSQETYLALVTRYNKCITDFASKHNFPIYSLDYSTVYREHCELRDELKYAKQCNTPKIRKKLEEMYMHMVKNCNDLMCKKLINQDRQAPFPVYFYGNTGVSKSVLTSVTQDYLCQVLDLPRGSQFIFNMNLDQRQDGFDSTMHTIIRDDLGFIKSKFQPNGDASTVGALQAINNAAVITEQAELENKGRIPIWTKLDIITSNTRGANIDEMMNYPSALHRRFGMRYQVTLKPEYRTKANMIDIDKVNLLVGIDKLRVWNVQCWDAVPKADNPNAHGADNTNAEVTWEKGPYFVNFVDDFLPYLGRRAKAHFDGQLKRSKLLDMFRDNKVCDECLRVTEDGKCACNLDSLFSEEPVSSPDEVKPGKLSKKGQRLWPVAVPPKPPRAPVWKSDTVVKRVPRIRVRGVKVKAQSGDVVYMFTWFSILYLIYSVFRRVFSPRNIAFVRKVCKYIYGYYRAAEQVEEITHDYRLISESVKSRFASVGRQYDRENAYYDKVLTALKVAASLYVIKRVYDYTKKTPVVNVQTCDYTGPTGHACGPYRSDMTPNPSYMAQGNVAFRDQSKFWQNNMNVITTHDIASSTLYYKSRVDELVERASDNVILIRANLTNGNHVFIRAICLGGFAYVTNAHYFMNRTFSDFYIIHDHNSPGANVTVVLQPEEFEIDKVSDVAVFYLRSLRPKKTLANLLCRGDLTGLVCDGFYLSRNIDGSVSKMDVKSVMEAYQPVGFTDGTCKTFRVYQSIVPSPTEDGFCGAPLFGITSYGPVLLGFHISGNKCLAHALQFGSDFLEKYNINTGPQMAPVKLEQETACKVLTAERFISHPKFLDSSATVYRYGSITGGGSRASSRVITTKMEPFIAALGYVALKGVPKMNNHRIFHKNLEAMTIKKSLINTSILHKCRDAYIDYLSQIPQSEYDQVRVLSDIEVINGNPDIDYIDGINRSTSAGFPWCTSKKKFLEKDVSDMYPDGVKFNDEIMNEYRRTDNNARHGVMSQRIHQISQKDEPLPHDKCRDYGTRLIMGPPIPDVMVERKYLLFPIRFFTRNRHRTGLAVGTVTQSREWSVIADELSPSDRIIAGDFSKFDKKQSVEVMHCAFDVFDYVCRRSGNYTPEDLEAVRTLRCDIIYALVNFDGDLLSFIGVWMSGISITTQGNCICLILLHMYGYYVSNPDKECITFFKNVKFRAYGDDFIAAVSKLCKFFDQEAMRDRMAEIGMTYTMAEKTAEFRPFLTLDEATFLKRRFVYDHNLKTWLAPLAEPNIFSSLMVWCESRNVTEDFQARQSIESAVREMFFHGKKSFNRARNQLTTVFKQAYDQTIELPTYAEVLNNYEELSCSVLKSLPYVPARICQAQGGVEYLPCEIVDKVRSYLACNRCGKFTVHTLCKKCLDHMEFLVFCHWKQNLRPCTFCGNLLFGSEMYSSICVFCLCQTICRDCHDDLCDFHVGLIRTLDRMGYANRDGIYRYIYNVTPHRNCPRLIGYWAPELLALLR